MIGWLISARMKVQLKVLLRPKWRDKSTFAEGGDYRAVRGHERESLLPYLMVSTCCRKHADFSTGVDQVVLARDVVSDEKKATVISRSTGCHQWEGKVFPNIEQRFFFGIW